MPKTCTACEGKRGRYSYGRRVSRWIACPACKGAGEVLTEEELGAAMDRFECPRCKALVGRLEMPLHAYQGIGGPGDTGFEFVASCPACDEERRKS
jgi:hypothetical protein